MICYAYWLRLGILVTFQLFQFRYVGMLCVESTFKYLKFFLGQFLGELVMKIFLNGLTMIFGIWEMSCLLLKQN